MKKISLLSVLLFVAVYLMSCGGGGKTESSDSLMKSREGFEKLIAQFEVPLYEGSEFVELGKIGSAAAIIYKTTDSADKVIDFYFNKMESLKLNFIAKSPAILTYSMNGKDIKVKTVQGSGPNRKNNDPLTVLVSVPGQENPGYQMIAFVVGWKL